VARAPQCGVHLATDVHLLDGDIGAPLQLDEPTFLDELAESDEPDSGGDSDESGLRDAHALLQ
jgi:hypothetical protein